MKSIMALKRNKFDLWLANLGVKAGTEMGKVRPVVIVQSDILNALNSTIVCPISSSPWEMTHLQIQLEEGESGLLHDSVIFIDQLRALDNDKLIRKLGTLSMEKQSQLNQKLKQILDLT
ncbi:type II toxin-antitoxin system PemK/MazF family toxin [Ekhidna sp.]|uniref:type II toxin-antitoxin system PemK/MazF family toxin n=1 Tax=Ekhidna sp. TaxID=2608089 RepID=UPI0032EC6960